MSRCVTTHPLTYDRGHGTWSLDNCSVLTSKTAVLNQTVSTYCWGQSLRRDAAFETFFAAKRFSRAIGKDISLHLPNQM